MDLQPMPGSCKTVPGSQDQRKKVPKRTSSPNERDDEATQWRREQKQQQWPMQFNQDKHDGHDGHDGNGRYNNKVGDNRTTKPEKR